LDGWYLPIGMVKRSGAVVEIDGLKPDAMIDWGCFGAKYVGEAEVDEKLDIFACVASCEGMEV
jgi:hypothetical protein